MLVCWLGLHSGYGLFRRTRLARLWVAFCWFERIGEVRWEVLSVEAIGIHGSAGVSYWSGDVGLFR